MRESDTFFYIRLAETYYKPSWSEPRLRIIVKALYVQNWKFTNWDLKININHMETLNAFQSIRASVLDETWNKQN